MRCLDVVRLKLMFVLLLMHAAESRLWLHFQYLAVSNRARRQARQRFPAAFIQYPESGGLEHIQNAYQAVSCCSQIAALCVKDHIILAYQNHNTSVLNVPLSSRLLTKLDISGNYILLTGIAGDCREIVKLAKKIDIDHSFQFYAPCSSLYLARALSAHLATGYAARPCACHVYVISPHDGGSIYEIACSGLLSKVRAGTAGRNMLAGRSLLEKHYHPRMNISEGVLLLNNLFAKTIPEGAIKDINESIKFDDTLPADIFVHEIPISLP
jgi:20S proteasome alpha/beta subunit